MRAPAQPTDWLDAFEILRIRLAFARVVPNTEAVADDFWQRLFDAAPSTRALFPGDIPARRALLKRTLIVLMTNLNRPAELGSTLSMFDCRWRGLMQTECARVEQAFIDTLARHLGDRFTHADRSAWTALHRCIVAAMTADACPAAAAA
jgi:nitric oxide dioxygenase